MQQVDPLAEAIAWLEKANADLEPELMSTEFARDRLALYARVKKLGAFGETILARRIDNATEIAKATGTSMGQAKTTLETAKALRESESVAAAFGGGDISFEQASEIAKADVAKPGAADELLKVAKEESFQVLRERSRSVVLETEQRQGLAERQRKARDAHSFVDAAGMVSINLKLQPHVGTPLVNRAEAEASRRFKEAKKKGKQESFRNHLADAYAAMLAENNVKGHSKRPELVVVVSHEVATRGWTDVREGEVCKVPGVGPIPPQEAKEIARDALLTAITTEGKDFRSIKRWSHDFPLEVRLALELGDPPEFEGKKCVGCGKRFRNENDHEEPHVAGGLASLANARPKCYECHKEKTKRDRKAGKLRPPEKRPPPDG